MDAEGGERGSATIHGGLNGCAPAEGATTEVSLPRLARLQVKSNVKGRKDGK